MLALHGAHWAALQTVAWGRMFLEFSAQDSVAAALTKTFDGQHPCPMCLKVREGIAKDNETARKRPVLSQVKTPEALWHVNVVLAPSPLLHWLYDSGSLAHRAIAFRDSPPVPPPRLGC